MNGTVSAEKLELSMLEIGIHLQDGNSVVRIFKRAHSEVTPSFQLEITGGPTGVFFIHRFIHNVNIIFKAYSRVSGWLTDEILPLRLQSQKTDPLPPKRGGTTMGHPLR
jgi:hypothetical protein